MGLIAAVLSIWVALSQVPDAPRKPLRERLLERAQHGEAEAQFELAKDYEGGRIGLPQDLTQAQHWYREAANQGDAFAEASLGIMYNVGKGVQRDALLAYMWLDRAVSHMTGAERDTLVEMRDSVGRKMTAGQLADARRMSKDHQAASK